MVENIKPAFDVAAFLRSAGLGRRIIQLAPKQPFFSQGDPADAVFYLQKGRARVTVVSATGKEATITLLSDGDFVGEEALLTMAEGAGHSHVHHCLHSPKNQPGRNDPDNAG